MGRVYQQTFENVALAAAVDLVTIECPVGKMMKILRHWIGTTDNTLATGQGLQLRGRLLTGTVTRGSGGTGSLTPSKTDPGDAACSSATCRTFDTSKSSATVTNITYENGCHLYQGDNWRYDYPPVLTASAAAGSAGSASFVFEMLTGTFQGSPHVSGGVLIEEFGG